MVGVSTRYVRWLARHALEVMFVAALVTAASVYLVVTDLPLRADFSYLLPQDAPAVRDLRELSRRLVTRDAALVIVQAPSSEARAAAVARIAERARAIPSDLVQRVETDDLGLREFVRAHRHVLVPLPDLVAARDALTRRIHDRKLAANPLFIDLDDEPAQRPDEGDQLDELRARRAAAEARFQRSRFVSEDGAAGLVVLRTAFSSTDAGRGKRLLRELEQLRAEVAGAGVEIGFAGGVITAVAEQSALVGGMVWSSVITVVLVGVLLLASFRDVVYLAAVTINLAVGTVAAFAFAALTIGHLNAATAFLAAIIAGNGVNYGILLVGRYAEEVRGRGHEPGARIAAMARAIDGTFRPTLVASLGAAIAYGSLAATSFRGFSDFAVIGAIGMVLCWLASFSLLPAILLRYGGARAYASERPPLFGGALARMFGGISPRLAFATGLALALAGGVIAARYLASDPLEYNLHNLRSSGDDLAEARRWMRISDAAFGKSISGQIYIGADRPEQVPLIVDALRRLDGDRPPEQRVIGGVSSLLDAVPPDQEQRIAVLREIRALLDDPALGVLDDDERREIAELRPPDDLRPITVDDVPREILEQVTERDGRVGLLIAVQPGRSLDQWNGVDLERFASAVRTLRLANGETVTTSGSSVVFADILAAVRSDGPIVTLVAAIAIVVMVLVVVGRNRQSVAVVAATALGTVLMIATCAVLGMRVNFLDFIALPITLGLGVDYAINLAVPASRGEPIRAVLRTTGASVVVCSLTTVVGYGSLLVSDNLAIRGFGLAALIGELACLLTALVLAPVVARRSQG